MNQDGYIVSGCNKKWSLFPKIGCGVARQIKPLPSAKLITDNLMLKGEMVIPEENWKYAINVVRSLSYCKFFAFYFLLNKFGRAGAPREPGIVCPNKQRLAH